MKLGTVVGGKGLRFGSNFTRWPEVKGQVKFQIAPIELKLGESDAGWEASTIRVRRRTPSEVKGQVKFQLAPIELKLGDGNAGWSRRTPSEVKGQVKFHIAPIEVKLGETDSGCRLSTLKQAYTKAGNLY